jgi:hypothetical protein
MRLTFKKEMKREKEKGDDEEAKKKKIEQKKRASLNKIWQMPKLKEDRL